MKKTAIISGLLLVASFGFGSAFAGPGVQVGDGSGPAGSGTPVNITVDFEGGGSTVGGQFRINYDDTNLTPDLTNGCTSVNWVCSIQSPGVLQYVSGAVPAGLPTENIGTIAFDISSAGPGNYDLTVSDELYGDIEENPVAPDGTVNGAITVEGAAAAYTSAPPPGALNVGSVQQFGTNPAVNVLITNSGAGGSTLTGTCSETSDPSDVFTVSGTTAFEVLQGDPGDTVTVTCDSTGDIDTHTGTMECSHDGDNLPNPAVYNLSCTITTVPEPTFSAAPNALNFNATEEDDPVPAQVFTITNSGDSGTTLQSSGAGCTITGADAAKFSMGDGTFTVPFGGSAIKSVSCDTSAEGSFSAQVDCTHNGTNDPSVNAVALSCEVGPPGAAIYASTPAPGFAFEFEEAVSPTDPPGLNLNIRNEAGQGDNPLFIDCQFDGGSSPQITYSPTYAGVPIAPGGQVDITLACDAEEIGTYTATLNCAYGVDGSSTTGGPGSGTATYTATCESRLAESDVDPSPADGTPLMGLADPGGTFPFNVVFTEVNDEGEDGSVSCSLADGTNFAITSPLGFPAGVPAGGSLTVTVTGTAPDDGSTSVTDTLNCTYFDSATGEGGVDVSYPLTLQIGGGGLFEVTKAYTGGYDGEVTVFLTCDTGLPLQQQFEISPDLPVFFVVTEFESGAMDCHVTEDSASGFEPTYLASGDSASDDDDTQSPGCHFFDVAGGDSNVCAITNSPAPVDVVIEKDWIITGAVGEEVFDYFELTLYCDGEIIDGSSVISDEWYRNFDGNGDTVFGALVVPNFPTTNCWVEENVSGNSGIEVDNGCTGIEVSLNNGASCVVTNTVFFEGIPTLGQWGMAIMALLMLGVGLVGFRRFI